MKTEHQGVQLGAGMISSWIRKTHFGLFFGGFFQEVESRILLYQGWDSGTDWHEFIRLIPLFIRIFMHVLNKRGGYKKRDTELDAVLEYN